MKKNKRKQGMPKSWSPGQKEFNDPRIRGRYSANDRHEIIYKQYLLFMSARQKIIAAAQLQEINMLDAVFDNDPESRDEAERIVGLAIERARRNE